MVKSIMLHLDKSGVFPIFLCELIRFDQILGLRHANIRDMVAT